MQLFKGLKGISASRSWVVKSRKQYLATESLRQAVDGRRHGHVKPRRRWTAEETAELTRLRSSGVLFKDLPSRFSGRSYDGILQRWSRLAQNRGGSCPRSSEIDILPRKKRTVTQDEREGVVALRHSGYTYKAIAAKIGLEHPSLVRSIYLSWYHGRANTPRPEHTPWSQEEHTLLQKLQSDGLTQRALIPFFPHRSPPAIVQRVYTLTANTRANLIGLAEPTRVGTWREDEDKQLETLYLQGRKVSFIAQELGRTAKQVYGRISRRRLVRPHDIHPQKGIALPSPGRSRHWSESDIERLEQGIKQNWTLPHLAQDLNRSCSAVVQRIRLLNLRGASTPRNAVVFPSAKNAS